MNAQIEHEGFPAAFELVIHESAESIFKAGDDDFRAEVIASGDATAEEFDNSEICWGGAEGVGEAECTEEQALEAVKALGFWGWTNTNTNIIHVWPGSATKKDLLALVAHEIGHNMPGKCEDHWQEEVRADGYAFAAVQAFAMVNRINKGR